MLLEKSDPLRPQAYQEPRQIYLVWIINLAIIVAAYRVFWVYCQFSRLNYVHYNPGGTHLFLISYLDVAPVIGLASYATIIYLAAVILYTAQSASRTLESDGEHCKLRGLTGRHGLPLRGYFVLPRYPRQITDVEEGICTRIVQMAHEFWADEAEGRPGSTYWTSRRISELYAYSICLFSWLCFIKIIGWRYDYFMTKAVLRKMGTSDTEVVLLLIITGSIGVLNPLPLLPLLWKIGHINSANDR